MEQSAFDLDYLAQIVALQVGRAMPVVLIGAAVILVAYLLSRLLSTVFDRVATRVTPERQPLVRLGRDVARYGVIGLGVVTGLGTMGIDVTAMVAGLGLTGFALGFALRDAVSNLLAGVLIILYQPFRVGDRITITGQSGKVVAIDFRYTELAGDDRRVLIPNGTMFSNPVVVEEARD